MSFLDELFGLKGKTALVTGGGRGIGQVVAIGLAKAGAEIAIVSRTGADETVGLIEKAGGKAYSLLADVTDEAAVDSALKQILARSGSLDIVFNNAGICIHEDTLKASIADWRQVIDINLTGEYIVARAAGRIMIEKGIKGSIINMASMSGSIVNVPQWQASYNASKAGVIHLTRSLAAEWALYGVRVNSLSPGYIATPMSVDTPQELKDAWMPLIPVHRMGNPEELIGAVIYLAADSSGYTNGSDLIVDGAYTCL
ncbi:SDR family oxidoreductase [Leadbettera azotonutricia]|uniref:Sorbose reductase SOU1 (Sorbitol utilization proteinSOU1) n=1 Tax=Leadbettera azotonutricia (strain ATCC BAA-888 / DSM 13862 / ZAS-9) TaxID=545695 RepID=F5Y7Q2_LEAAZ|nr:SDR family oxidoreductase [Leadbettera azotonutricia]AEF81754.1 sorbose reductase SOU1 (Sorbitol utilization proteinSOU1) [Leadbettera azotonutricia ZAS-9]